MCICHLHINLGIQKILTHEQLGSLASEKSETKSVRSKPWICFRRLEIIYRNMNHISKSYIQTGLPLELTVKQRWGETREVG
jgi:hypothetical protein